MTDLAIVSMHERGFPQADLYLGQGETDAMEFERLGLSPDTWFSLRTGDTLEMAFAKAQEYWPTAKVVYAADDDETEDDS